MGASEMRDWRNLLDFKDAIFFPSLTERQRLEFQEACDHLEKKNPYLGFKLALHTAFPRAAEGQIVEKVWLYSIFVIFIFVKFRFSIFSLYRDFVSPDISHS